MSITDHKVFADCFNTEAMHARLDRILEGARKYEAGEQESYVRVVDFADLSEADKLDWLADQIADLTDDADAVVSATSLRDLALDARADAEATARRDELVEKVARLAWNEGVRSGMRCEWEKASVDSREQWRDHARNTIRLVLDETRADR